MLANYLLGAVLAAVANRELENEAAVVHAADENFASNFIASVFVDTRLIDLSIGPLTLLSCLVLRRVGVPFEFSIRLASHFVREVL